LGFPFALPHISLSQGECVWVLLLLSFIPNLFWFCLVISLINLGDEHEIRVVTLSMISTSFFFFLPSVLDFILCFCLLLLFCLFYEEFSPKISYQILMD
jgi:hypothetical protein